MRPSALVDVVLADVVQSGRFAPASLEVYAEIWDRFASFCERGRGLTDANAVSTEDVQGFLDAPRWDGGDLTSAARHFRRGSLRTLFREGRRLGMVGHDPTLDIALERRPVISTRPLTDEEVDWCRLHALNPFDDLRLPVVWALAEATARMSEIPFVRVRDLDLDQGLVFVAGNTRTDPRWAPLSDWGALHLRRRLEDLGAAVDPDTTLATWRRPNPKRPGNAATMAIIEVLRAAGLHGEPEVRPASVVAWAGTRLLRAGASIDEVARSLGCRSLDQAAAIVGFEWRVQP